MSNRLYQNLKDRRIRLNTPKKMKSMRHIPDPLNAKFTSLLIKNKIPQKDHFFLSKMVEILFGFLP